MSMIICSKCQEIKDSDNDPEGFYVIGYDFCCEDCRDFYNLEPNFNKEQIEVQTDIAMDKYYEDEDEVEVDLDDGGPSLTDDDLSDQAKFIRDAFKEEEEKP